MNKNSKKLIFGTANKRQRYTIRKLTICAASVLLDTTFLFGAGQTVQADTTGQESEQKEETVQLNKDETVKETQSTSVGDASSNDTSASDVHEQNKQVTTNNYTTQKKNPSKKSTKKSPTKSNKTKQTKQAKQSQK
ncbi:YSIRK-type signal peptide-containing protein [Lactobacillus amylovorus]|uniref:YSIRK-type signal peptide-containing protein n=1 Tax=Lactobacillus amylovorus TaxID=1604 RepID=UPI00232AA5D8|nr:YSIRK-type signal peptide-containing protein [Lactobacillus amylovorus]MDB6225298.1 YSIRK-type signal peptide-containing protein [Lactobacillus amylovorus]MDB6228921.1 YSIRK-type signal peptide-containing protein [Lactobacillus amylovorus]